MAVVFATQSGRVLRLWHPLSLPAPLLSLICLVRDRQIGDDDWTLETTGAGVVERGEWYYQADLSVVNRDYNSTAQDVIVQVRCPLSLDPRKCVCLRVVAPTPGADSQTRCHQRVCASTLNMA